MSKVFITGDRQGSQVYPVLVFIEMLRATGRGDQVETGTNDGVEAMVREIAQQADVPLTLVDHETLDNLKPDFDTRAKALAADDDVKEVVVIHADPHTSHVYRAAVENVEAKTRLVTHADLMV